MQDKWLREQPFRKVEEHRRMVAASVFGTVVATLRAVPLVRCLARACSRRADAFRNEILSLLARRRFCICLRAPFLPATGAAPSIGHLLPGFAVRAALPTERPRGNGNQGSAAND
jgi:hypothetical protein